MYICMYKLYFAMGFDLDLRPEKPIESGSEENKKQTKCMK